MIDKAATLPVDKLGPAFGTVDDSPMIRGCSDTGKHAREIPADDEISGCLIPVVHLCQIKHRVSLSEVRAIEGLRHHDRASLTPLFAELQAAVLVNDDVERMNYRTKKNKKELYLFLV